MSPRSITRYLSVVIMLASVVAGLYWTVDGNEWTHGWAFLALFAIYANVLAIWLVKTRPDLYVERRSMAENIEPWDFWVVRFHGFLLLSILFVAALDSGRFKWSTIPVIVQVASWLGLLLVAVLIWHLMAVNDFLSSWVRIQDDRNQVVVTRGAYRFVRHPMYIAIIVSDVFVPLLLVSYWALIPGLLDILLIIYRTAREDRTLSLKLAGYREYSTAVRYRLIPGIW